MCDCVPQTLSRTVNVLMKEMLVQTKRRCWFIHCNNFVCQSLCSGRDLFVASFLSLFGSFFSSQTLFDFGGSSECLLWCYSQWHEGFNAPEFVDGMVMVKATNASLNAKRAKVSERKLASSGACFDGGIHRFETTPTLVCHGISV